MPRDEFLKNENEAEDFIDTQWHFIDYITYEKIDRYHLELKYFYLV